MKYWHIVIVFLVGMVLFIPGAIFTFMEWPYSSELLIAGSVLKIAAALLLLVRVISKRNNNSILNK